MNKKQLEMNRPISPTSIVNVPREDISMSGVDDFHNAAHIGFELVKNKLQKQTIKPGEILLEFYKYSGSSVDELTSLFCVSILVLVNLKNYLNEVNDDTYDKIRTYTISQYSEKLDSL